jgi:hypothetical protein
MPASGGFTLVMTLSILAAVTILVVGLFSIVARERKTSTSFDAVEQADLAVQAGLEQAGALLKQALLDENGIIMAVPTAPWITDEEVEQDSDGVLQKETGRESRAALVAANFTPNVSSLAGGSWRYVPLVSGVATSEQQGEIPPDSELADLKEMVRPAMPGAFVNGDAIFKMDPVGSVPTPEELRDLKHQVQRLTKFEPWLRTPSAYWVELTRPVTPEDPPEEDGETVASRFCFYVEDLQGLVNLGTAGNVDTGTPDVTPVTGLHSRQELKLAMNVRAGYPRQLLGFHAVPGLNVTDPLKPLRNQMSLHTLLQPNVDSQTGALGINARLVTLNQRLVGLRSMMFSPDMWREAVLVPDTEMQWAGMEEATLSRRYEAGASVPVGRYAGELIDSVMGRLERNVTAGLQGYDELALIPYEPGISGGGQRKLNLNAALNRIEKAANANERATRSAQEVNTIAAHVQLRLPQFAAARAGGYPFPGAPRAVPASQTTAPIRAAAYLRCLSAGLLDYADTDAHPNMDGNPMSEPGATTGVDAYPTYRGMDSFPVVTEQWQRYRLEPASNGTVRYSISSYLELWNMTNQEIAGSVAAVFECNGFLTAGFVAGETVVQAVDRYGVSGQPGELSGVKGGRWHKAVNLNPPLRPNEYRVVKFEDIVMQFPRLPGAVESVIFKGSTADADNDFRSRYRLAYQPLGMQEFRVVDQPLWPVDRNPRTVSASVRQKFNTTNPGSGYGNRLAREFINNIGDPRAAFFVCDRQHLISYPDDSSPGGRNVREADIRATLFGETRVNLWPDGGHNSPAPPNSPGNENRVPDDPSFRLFGASGQLVERDAQKYVQVISNRGRFFSLTELGHVFDPLMWDPDGGSETSLPTYAQFANIRPGGGATLSHRFCGGTTLRMGRPEHDRFRPDFAAFPQAGRPNTRGTSATALLDLFHCGKPTSGVESELIGDLVRIEGQININTATRDALRVALAGRLVMDPQLKFRSQDGAPNVAVELQPPTSQDAAGSSSSTAAHADLLAELIIRNRPYVSAAQLPEKVLMPTAAELAQRPLPREIQVANVRGRVLVDGQPVMGATVRGSDDRSIEPEWNDAAAEEAFARIFNSATVRSRNFRVVVAGQAVRKTRSGLTKVLATRSRLYHVFIRPIRDAAGNVIRQQTEILYARTL